MRTVACPHCRHSMEDDGSLAGEPVQCPQCRGTFQMPAFDPMDVGARPRSGGKKFKSTSKPGRHWTKTAMLVATVLWPICAVGYGAAGGLMATPRLAAGSAGAIVWANGKAQVVRTETDYSIWWPGFYWNAGKVTLLYLLLMFALFVVWFATTEPHPR